MLQCTPVKSFSAGVCVFNLQMKEPVCMYVCTYVFMSVCVYVHTYLCMYTHAGTHTHTSAMSVCVYVHTHLCMYTDASTQTHTSALRGKQRDARVWPRVHVPAVNPQTRCSPLPLLPTVIRGRENMSPEALIYIYYTHTHRIGG